MLKELFILKLIDADELCETLLTMSFVTGTDMKLIRYFIEADFIRNKDEESNLLMEGSLATKLLKYYLVGIGNSYLIETLGKIIDQITIAERKASLEINPR